MGQAARGAPGPPPPSEKIMTPHRLTVRPRLHFQTSAPPHPIPRDSAAARADHDNRNSDIRPLESMPLQSLRSLHESHSHQGKLRKRVGRRNRKLPHERSQWKNQITAAIAVNVATLSAQRHALVRVIATASVPPRALIPQLRLRPRRRLNPIRPPDTVVVDEHSPSTQTRAPPPRRP